MNERHLTQEIQESLARRANQVAISTEVAQRIAAAPALDALFYRVVHLVQEKFGYYHAHVYTLDNNDALTMQEGTGLVGRKMKVSRHTIALNASQSIVAQAARSRHPILVQDVSQNPHWLPNPLLPNTKSELAVPIKLGEDVLGVLDVQNDMVDSLDEEDELMLLGLCGQIAVAINNQRLETKRKEAEDALRTYAEELERSNHELQRFAQVASHDLQEPLRKIQTFSDRLQHTHQHALDTSGQDYLSRIRRSAAQMQELLNDVIKFTRVITAGQPFRKVNIAEIIQHVLHELEPRIRATQAEIIINPIPIIEGDSSQLYQLFQALISNAIKFHKPDVAPIITITAHVSQSTNGDYCQIEITDNGIGLKEKYLDRIFEAFERLHSGHSYRGTGIGLAVCRKVVERHRGHITAKSQLGVGTTFIVQLPITQSLITNHLYGLTNGEDIQHDT